MKAKRKSPSRPSSKARATHQTKRVEKAVAKAQARIPTAFHITVVRFTAEEKLEAGCQKKLMVIERTVRGDEDSWHFVLSFDPVVSERVSFRDLVKVAGHEVLHALLWPIADAVQRRGITEKQAEELARAEENIVYTLQRALFGEIRA